MDDIIRTDEWVYYRNGEQDPFTRLYQRPSQVGVLRSGEPKKDRLRVPDRNLYRPKRGVNPVPLTEICPPGTLFHTHVFDGEELVMGGDDGQTWVASFASQAAAKNFITWSVTHSKSWSGLRPESSEPESPH